MAGLQSSLNSRVGRRLVLLFALCALLPLLALAGTSYRAIRSYLLNAGYEELRAGSKSYAMSLLDRLQLLESALYDAAAQAASDRLTPSMVNVLEQRFESVGSFSAAGEYRALTGVTGRPVMLPAGPPPPSEGERALILSAQPLILAVPLDSASGGTSLVVGCVRPDYLWWGGAGEDTLPPRTAMHVLAGGVTVLSTYPLSRRSAAEMAQTTGAGGRGQFDWHSDGQSSVAGYWTLPLGLHFDGEDWSVVWSRSRAEVLAPVRQFRTRFVLVLVATFLGVVLLALRQIRHTLNPLEQLRLATLRLAQQDFSTTVEVSSGDEFEDLAGSFNAMAGRLADLVADLHQHQLGTLQALARAIDERSSWTLGHSGRVAQLSLRIGQHLGLAQEDQRALHRAALLHDIGKLRIPSETLQKAGPLDQVERLALEGHVDAGVRILSPLPGYEGIRPIVAQHHERLDGSGYPRGLRGSEIGLGARILAVADSYDAMSSDRPYRSGIPHEDILEELHSCSGTLYDPAVVDALEAVLEDRPAARGAHPS